MPDTFQRVAEALAGRYRIERELGAGGMATVYLAFDVKHHRKVAVKVLRPELAAALGGDRFTREIETAAQFQHPHVLPLLDSGEASSFLYYVMPYVEGESLRDRLARHGELPIHDAVKILIEITDALAYAHAHGVVHRDIKPDNVLLSGRHALVMDFGVAKALSEATGRRQLTTAGIALGTPAYMAPEQAAADPHVDHRVDIYAVGVLGYELIAGRPPFTAGSTQEVLAAHVSQPPEPVTKWRPACPPALAEIIMKCLEKRPADRWQTADDLLAQLEPLATPSGGTTPTGMRPPAAQPHRAARRRGGCGPDRGGSGRRRAPAEPPIGPRAWAPHAGDARPRPRARSGPVAGRKARRLRRGYARGDEALSATGGRRHPGRSGVGAGRSPIPVLDTGREAYHVPGGARHRDRAGTGGYPALAHRGVGVVPPRWPGRARRTILSVPVGRLALRTAPCGRRAARHSDGQGAPLSSLVAGRSPHCLRRGQRRLRHHGDPREHRRQQHLGRVGGSRRTDTRNGRPVAQRQSCVGARPNRVALHLDPRRRPRRLSGRPDRLGSTPRVPGAAHDRARRPRHQCLGGRHASRLRGVRGTVERLVVPPSRPRGGGGLDRASGALDPGQPDDRDGRPLPRRRVACVRLRPERRATDLPRPPGRGRAGAGHQRVGGGVLSQMVARRPGDLIPLFPRGAAARVRVARRGWNTGAGRYRTGRPQRRTVVARWPTPAAAREHGHQQPDVGRRHPPSGP